MPWLETYTFPEEAKFSDVNYAKRVYSAFVRELWKFGTTRSVIFATIHKNSTTLLMDLFADSGLGAYVGNGIDQALTEEIGVKTLTSSAKLPGKAGMISIDYNTGLRTLSEQQDLYNTCMNNGIDVYVCSASFIDVVKTFASNPKYKYNIPEENVFAMEVHRD